jgi:PAS domain S-box-containing protein
MREPLDTIHVLHVDDEPDLGEMVATFLEREDDRLTVQTATRPGEGLGVLADSDIDCIISDYDMPGTNGIEFLETVRTWYPELPFILYTGKGSEEIASDAISAGVTDYLQKESGSSHYSVLANRVTNAVERHRSRQAVERTQQKLTEIADKTDDVLFMFDGDWSELLFVNSSYEEIWNGSIAELEADPTSFLEEIHPADRQKARQSMDRLMDGTSDTVEFRITAAEGGYRWVRGETKPIVDDEGAVTRIVGFVRDITERNERERDLRQKERRYQAIFNDPNILAGLVETDGRVIDVNETAMEYVSASPDAVAGQPVWDAPWFEDGEVEQTDVKGWVDRAANGEYVDFEAELGDPDGERYTVEGVVRPVTDDEEQVVSLFISVRDVTERKERERELRRYEAYLEESTDVITVLDETGTIKYQSPAVERILGYEPAEFVGQNGFDFIHPDDVGAVSEAFADLVEEPGRTETIECRFKSADGRWRWLEVRGTNQLANDPINGIVTNNRDITDRKARERELERHEAYLQESDDIITVFDDSGTIRYVGPGVTRILGFDQAELTGQNAFDFVHPDDVDAVVDTFGELVGQPGATAAAEFRFRTASGEWCWLEARGTNRLETDPVNGIVTNSREITERKQRERELEQYETLVEVAGDPMYMLDAAGHIEYVNEKFVELSGYPEATLVGEHVGILMDEDDVTAVEEEIRSLLSAGESRGTFELTAVTADGDRIPAENHVSLLTDDGEYTGSVGVLRVIRDRLERQRRLKRERDRFEQFANVVSHDLRNPLSVASGRLELVRAECDSEHVAAIETAHQRMEALIDDVLSLATAGETVGETEPVDLASLGERCWQNVATASAALDVDVDADSSIQADRSRLQQLLENLFGNAVQHAGPGVTVTVGGLADGFYVEDDGPGIPPDERDDVFIPGYTSGQDGTGFGLNIVQEIAEAHAWDVELTESPDGGARFEFRGVQAT